MTADGVIDLIHRRLLGRAPPAIVPHRVDGQTEGIGWNRTRVSKRGGQVQVELNGRALSTTPIDFHTIVTVPISIVHEGGVMTLANIFVRERP